MNRITLELRFNNALNEYAVHLQEGDKEEIIFSGGEVNCRLFQYSTQGIIDRLNISNFTIATIIQTNEETRVEKEKRTEELKETLEDMTNQFSIPREADDGFYLSTGGFSSLELAFRTLGWEDPKPCPERECQMDGCLAEATCGTNTALGYMRVCGRHFAEERM